MGESLRSYTTPLATRNTPGSVRLWNVDPRDFGAYFDNVHDDTVAIQNCWNFVSAAGGGTVITPGIALTSQQGVKSVNGGVNNAPYNLLLPNNVYVVGQRGYSGFSSLNQHASGLVSDVCDNIILADNISAFGLDGIGFYGNAQNADPQLTNLTSQGGYGLYISGGSSLATITKLFVSGMRQSVMCVGGDSITSAAQVPGDLSISDIGYNILGLARTIVITALQYSNIWSLHGVVGDGVYWSGGPFNHANMWGVSLVKNANSANQGTVLLLLANNTIRDCTDVDIAAFTWVGKALAGVLVQSAANTSNWDSPTLSRVKMELGTPTGTSPGFDVQNTGGGAVVGLLHDHCTARLCAGDGFSSSSNAQSSVIYVGCFSEKNGGYGYNCKGTGKHIYAVNRVGSSGSAGNTSGAFANQGGDVIAIGNQWNNGGGFGANQTSGTLYAALNDISGNASAWHIAGGTATSYRNKGYDRLMGAVTGTPTTTPVSGTKYQNTTGVDLLVGITGGTVSNITVYDSSQLNGITIATATNVSFILPPNCYYSVTSSAQPTASYGGL